MVEAFGYRRLSLGVIAGKLPLGQPANFASDG
jgi:hypothetical protein